MKIETLDDWNLVLGGCGCCPMPECPLPIVECQSLSASASPKGYRNPEDSGATLYAKKIWRLTYSYSETVTADHVAGGTYTAVSGSGSGNYDFVWESVAPAYGLANASMFVGGCQSVSPIEQTYCNGSGSWERNTFEDWALQDGGGVIVSSGTDPETETSRFYTDVGGEDNGEGETYPSCWFKVDDTYVEWTNCHSLTPGFCDGLPVSATTPVTSYQENLSGWPAGTTTDSSNIYEDGADWESWLAAVKAHLKGMMDFDDPENSACIGSLCSSSLAASKDAWLSEYTAFWIRKSRYRIAIPDTFPGSFFKVSWDVVFIPESGDAYFMERDKTWIWAGPGDPENPDSWKSEWFEIPLPEQPGEVRRVNFRFECYKSEKFGVKPQVDGEAVELEDLENESGSIGLLGSGGDGGNVGLTGGLRSGGLRSSGLRIGGLSSGRLQIGGLRTGGLQIGGLRTGGLRVGGLRMGGLRTGGLRTGGLTTGVLRVGSLSSGGIRIGTIRTGSLRVGGLGSGGGLRTGGLRISSL